MTKKRNNFIYKKINAVYKMYSTCITNKKFLMNTAHVSNILHTLNFFLFSNNIMVYACNLVDYAKIKQSREMYTVWVIFLYSKSSSLLEINHIGIQTNQR